MNKENKITVLYRAYDCNNILLYVGISSDVINRVSHHGRHAEWHSKVSKITIEHIGTRRMALLAEKEAIIKENPLYNRVHSTQNNRNRKVKEPKKMIEKDNIQIGFFVSPSVKAKLQSLSMENGRTMSAQLTEMINRDYKKMLSAQLRGDKSQALSK